MKDTLIKFSFTYDQCYEFGKLFDKLRNMNLKFTKKQLQVFETFGRQEIDIDNWVQEDDQ